jgi:hypothetical protein
MICVEGCCIFGLCKLGMSYAYFNSILISFGFSKNKKPQLNQLMQIALSHTLIRRIEMEIMILACFSDFFLSLTPI